MARPSPYREGVLLLQTTNRRTFYIFTDTSFGAAVGFGIRDRRISSTNITLSLSYISKRGPTSGMPKMLPSILTYWKFRQ